MSAEKKEESVAAAAKEEGEDKKRSEVVGVEGLRVYLDGFGMRQRKALEEKLVASGMTVLKGFVQTKTTHVVVPMDKWEFSPGGTRAGKPIAPESWAVECAEKRTPLPVPVPKVASWLDEIESANAAAGYDTAANDDADKAQAQQVTTATTTAAANNATTKKKKTRAERRAKLLSRSAVPPPVLFAVESPQNTEKVFESSGAFEPIVYMEPPVMASLHDLLYGDLKLRDQIDDPRAKMPERVELMSITALDDLAAFSFEELRYRHICMTECDAILEMQKEEESGGDGIIGDEFTSIFDDSGVSHDREGSNGRHSSHGNTLQPPDIAALPQSGNSGKLWMWGCGLSGQLGTGSSLSRDKLVFVEELCNRSIVSVACGAQHTLVLDEFGGVFAFGNGYRGQLGLGTKSSSVPVRVPALSLVRCSSIACGSFHSVAVSNGNLFTWGCGDSGQLGHGRNSQFVYAPQQVSATLQRNVVLVAAGGKSTIALTRLGNLYVFGDNHAGQLAVPAVGTRKRPPVVWSPLMVSPPAAFNFIAMGETHAAALSSDGTLYTWGRNFYGCLGHGRSGAICGVGSVDTFVGLAGKEVAAPPCCFVSCGKFHTAVITSRGLLFMIGDASHMKTGLSDECKVPTQLNVTEGNGELQVKFKHVSCGAMHTVATSYDGNVWTWGSHENCSVLSEAETFSFGPYGEIVKPQEIDDSTVAGRKKLLASSAAFVRTAATSTTGTAGVGIIPDTAVGPRAAKWLSGAVMAVAGPNSSHTAVVVAEQYVPSQYVKDGNAHMLEALPRSFDLREYPKMKVPLDFSPLHAAALCGNVASVRFFTGMRAAAGAPEVAERFDLDVADSDGDTALHVAARRGNYECARELLRAGARDDIKNAEGDTPLHVASAYGFVQVVSALLANRADRSLTNEKGMTALHCAVAAGNVAVAKMLVQNAAQIEVLDKDGRTPLDLTQNKSFVAALKQIGQHREVFISYAHADLDFAKKLKLDLEKSGLRCWIDLNILAAGSDWRSDIGNGIMQAKLLVFIISKVSSISEWCIKELHLARQKGLPVIPLFLERVPLITEVAALVSGSEEFDFSNASEFRNSADGLIRYIGKILSQLAWSSRIALSAPAVKRIPVEDLIASRDGERFLFISHPIYRADPEMDLERVAVVQERLLNSGIQSCADVADMREMEGHYYAKLWDTNSELLLRKAAGALLVVTKATLKNPSQLAEISAAVKLFPDRTVVAFFGANPLSRQQQDVGGSGSSSSSSTPPSDEQQAVKADLVEKLGDCQVFHLDTKQGVVQLVYTVLMWEREVDQKRRVATLNEELELEGEALSKIEEDVASVKKYYYFHEPRA